MTDKLGLKKFGSRELLETLNMYRERSKGRVRSMSREFGRVE
jgi:hypothetical protein